MAGSPSTTLFSPVLGTPELVSSLAGLGGAAWCTFLVSPGLRRDGLWCVWEGRRQVAGGSRKKAEDGSFLSTERGKFLVGAQRARIKEPLFSVLGCRQLPPPPCSCQGRPPLLAWLLVCCPRPGPPQPPRPQTTGSFSSASSDLGVPDPISVPSGSAAETRTHGPFLFSSPGWRRAGLGAASAWPAAPLRSPLSAA